MMENFLKQINKHTTLKSEEVAGLTGIAKTRFYKKGEAILKLGQINDKLYFINEGLVKLSFFKEDKEFVMKFFFENGFCAVLDSLINDEPSSYTIIALQDVRLTEIDFSGLKKLASQNHAFEKLISGISSMATQHMMKRIRELLETDASERYLDFLKNNSHLVNLISLKDLSGYLGISQVSLSRIRARARG